MRATSAAGCVTLLLAGANVLILPAAVVGVIAGTSGLRLTDRDLDPVRLRLGVALVASVLALVGNAASGDPGLTAAGVAAAVCFTVAWSTCDRLRRERRLAWGVRHREAMERLRQLDQRRTALRDGHPPPPDQQASGSRG